MRISMTKAQFAKAKGRSRGCISNWIATGKITKAALVGEGVRARVLVEQAERDLIANLDPVQQMALERKGRPSALTHVMGAAHGSS